MKKPTLIIMAAGMGSRYGGLKQMDKLTKAGDIILDFSLYDAWKAGFERVCFIIKPEMEEDFKALMAGRADTKLELVYAFQTLDKIPAGYTIPEGRVKPWGTSHAVLCARDLIDGPCVVINADDYYGPEAFKKIYDFLTSQTTSSTDCASTPAPAEYAMVGYLVQNTLTENGTVSRGVCQADSEGYLSDIVERTKIGWQGDGIAYTEDDGDTWTEVPAGTLVSMNFWGFTEGLMQELEDRFPAFLDRAAVENPMKGEYLLPRTVGEMLEEGKARVKVLSSTDKWFGVTYKEDREGVVAALESMKAQGRYPEDLWK